MFLLVKRRHPPVQRMLPVVFRLLRVFGAIVFLLSLVTGWLLIDDGETLRGVSIAISGAAFLALTWFNPLSRAFRIAFAVAVAALALAGGPLFALLIGIIAAGLFVFSRVVRITVDPDSVRRLDPDAVMSGAEPAVEEFMQRGWRQIGAVGFTVLRRTVVESILVPDQVDRYAAVTDAVWVITSQIDDVRRLITRNSGRSAVSGSILSNDWEGATPSELIDRHASALAVLRKHGAEAVPLVVDQIVDQVVRDEKAELGGGVRRRGRDDPGGPIDESEEAERRIRTWLGTPTID